MCLGKCDLLRVLTLDPEEYAPADGRRHSVRGDAEVGAHMESAHPRDVEYLSVDNVHCDTTDRHRHP